MNVTKEERTLHKEPLLKNINEQKVSALRKYQDFFVGSTGLGALLKYELFAGLFGPLPGALGLFLRKQTYPLMVRAVGSGVAWGRNIALRHPNKISIGQRVAIDDNCLLDAKGGGEEGITIGDDVLIARSTLIQAKTAPVKIGNRCTIGSQCQFSSAGGIVLGDTVMVGGQSYIGGGRYYIEDRETPIMDQGLYTKGPVVIDDDVWIGAGVTILDGVHIGRGCVIGSGAVVRQDLPPFSVATPYQKLVMVPRGDGSQAS